MIVRNNKKASNGLPNPPLKDNSLDHESITTEASLTQDEISAVSGSSDVDYSNPNRKIVYNPSAPQEASLNLEPISEVSDVSSFEPPAPQTTQTVLESIREPLVNQERVLDFGDDELESDVAPEVPSKSLPTVPVAAAQLEPQASKVDMELSDIIDEITDDKLAKVTEIVVTKPAPVLKSKASEDSFEFSELSDVTDTVDKTKKLFDNFSDDEDDDLDIIAAEVQVTSNSAPIK